MTKEKRYQYQPWYIKIWRWRHYVFTPYYATKIWFYEKISFSEKNYWPTTFKECWRIAVAFAQVNMNWVYDWDEVEKRLSYGVKNKKD